MFSNTLFLITARGGSKGIPKKNIKVLGDRSLIGYAIDLAKSVGDVSICVSTDDRAIAEEAERCGVAVPFLRPDELAQDGSSSYPVIIHALDEYKKQGMEFENVVLLQPTSPFRLKKHLVEAFKVYQTEDCTAVFSSKIADANPYYNLYEEDDSKNLKRSKASDVHQRQMTPEVYELNGAIYVLNVDALYAHNSLTEFPSIKNYVMDKLHSVDIDDRYDWMFAEQLLRENFIELDY